MCYSISSTETLRILRYQYIARQTKLFLTCKYNILQICKCNGSHITMATAIKIAFNFVVQLAYPVIMEISDWQESQPCCR